MLNKMPLDKKIVVTTNMRQAPIQGKMVMNKKQMRKMMTESHPVKFNKRYK